MSVSYQRAQEVKHHASELFSQFGPVNGVGVTQTDDGFAVKINFEREPDDRSAMPATVDGVPVTIDVVGKIRADMAR